MSWQELPGGCGTTSPPTTGVTQGLPVHPHQGLQHHLTPGHFYFGNGGVRGLCEGLQPHGGVRGEGCAHGPEASMPFSIPGGWAVQPLLGLCMSMMEAKDECMCLLCLGGTWVHVCGT